MKKKYLLLSLLLSCICIWLVHIINGYYAGPQLREPYRINKKQNDSILRIAYIGDSWAFMHQKHNCHISKLLEDTLHCPTKVDSYGMCGLTSKKIYENLFINNDFKHFIQQNKYDYCFLSAGINDTYKKMSTKYYKQSMDGIIQFLIENHIHPIILEIPDYNIQKSFDRQMMSRKVLRRLSMIINDTPLDCKQVFRDALNELIREKGYQDKIIIIRYQSWNNDFLNDQRELYLDDGMHLKEKGYAKLDSMIAERIIRDR